MAFSLIHEISTIKIQNRDIHTPAALTPPPPHPPSLKKPKYLLTNTLEFWL